MWLNFLTDLLTTATMAGKATAKTETVLYACMIYTAGSKDGLAPKLAWIC